jgi:acetyl-CoA acetyltransferase
VSAGVAALPILGVDHGPRGDGERFEELIFRVAAGALANAGLGRDDIDTVTLAASDERDGRSISSMLSAAPAGGVLKQVTKVTDGSLHALAVGAMKVRSGLSEAGLVVSWDVASEADLEACAVSALEPFAERPVGAIDPAATALLASAYLQETRVGVAALDARAAQKAIVAGRSVTPGEWAAHPLRTSHLAPERDGAAAVVVSSPAFAKQRGATPAGVLLGLGWRTDTYSPGERARPLTGPLRGAVDDALRHAGTTLDSIASFELEDLNVFAECLAVEGVGLAADGRGLEFLASEADPLHRLADDGWVGLPSMCTGLWRLAQVCRADGEGLSLIHQTVGRAAQGHAVAIVRRRGRELA